MTEDIPALTSSSSTRRDSSRGLLESISPQRSNDKVVAGLPKLSALPAGDHTGAQQSRWNSSRSRTAQYQERTRADGHTTGRSHGDSVLALLFDGRDSNRSLGGSGGSSQDHRADDGAV